MKLIKAIAGIGFKVFKPFVVKKLEDPKFKNHLIDKLNLKINLPGLNEEKERVIITKVVESTIEFIKAL